MSLESLHRPLIAVVASAMVSISLPIIGVTLTAPQPAKATTQRPVNTMPACMRRVTVHSKPCGARIYIDGTQVGQTPMSFPMPMGRYTLVLLAPGHQQYTQRILVPDAPLEIEANRVVSR